MKQCFVIMPIGSEEDYEKYKDIYECMIKETVTGAGLELQCVRADEVSKSGAIIKDIIKRLYEADVVIADLSGLNPNVCYELGVRHALKGGTIMIVDDIESIPFDLKPYRVVEYSTTLRGAYEFGQKLKAFLEAALDDPHGADNPVLDFLPRPELEQVEQAEAIHNRQLIDELRSELAEKTDLLADEIASLRHSRARYTPPPSEVRGKVSPEVREVIETLTERIEKLEEATAVVEAVDKVAEAREEKTAEQWVEDGDAAFALDNYQEAIEAYSKAIELNPNDVLAIATRAAIYGQIGEPEKAMTDFDKAIELSPKLAIAYVSHGMAAYRMEELEKALADFKKAIELDPTDCDAHNSLAYVLYDMDRVEEAVKHWKKAVELESYADTHAGLGLGLWKMREKERAVQEYRRALELDERYADLEWLPTEPAWSDKAIADARPLIEEAKKEKP
jgi:tetratricopeptide (TPR) repeat protein